MCRVTLKVPSGIHTTAGRLPRCLANAIALSNASDESRRPDGSAPKRVIGTAAGGRFAGSATRS